jgi:DNA topoisomerase-1
MATVIKQAESPVRVDPVDSAAEAGLRYVSDEVPGIRRQAHGKGFVYLDAKGRRVRDSETHARIRSLVIPPAWTDVWICPADNGHLQATGRDARGRKQYRYHPRWREVRDDSKYGRVIAFARALPRIRRRVASDLKKRGLSREKVLATVTRLLETTLIRVGNDDYAKNNGSYGLTTMHDRHVRVKGKRIRFEFRGKSGVNHEIDFEDQRLARIVQQSQDLPGQELFQYLDDDGEVRDIGSDDVNNYLREISGADFTAKDFRTWAGTKLAAQALQEFEDFDSHAAAKRNITRAIESVAERLGNTTAVCRKCYVHPEVINAYMDRSLMTMLKQRAEREVRERLRYWTAEETVVLTLLQERMKRQLEPRRGKRRKPR